MQRPKTGRAMTLEQRAEISATKRFNKETQPELWKQWYDYYLNFLVNQAIPASNLPSTYEGKYDGFGQYVRVRPKDVKHFEQTHA